MVFTISYSEADLTKTSKVVYTAFSIFSPNYSPISLTRSEGNWKRLQSVKSVLLFERKCKQIEKTTKENYCFCNTARCTVEIG
jgi:hypothetical protein